MKIIQVPMEEQLLRAVNRLAKARGSTRAAPLRKACEEHLLKTDEEGLDRRYVEGYRRKPESPVWGEVGAKMAAEVLDEEDWDEEG